jgi:hypothetical protein
VRCALRIRGQVWSKDAGITERFEAIRARIGGRLDVYALDTANGKHIGFDDTSRYAMASTFKLMLAAAVLSAIAVRSRLPLRGSSGLGPSQRHAALGFTGFPISPACWGEHRWRAQDMVCDWRVN